MNTALWMENITAHWIQASVLVTAGAALPALFGLRAPRPMLRCWQALLAACLPLPFAQPWLSRAALQSVVGTAQPAGAHEAILDRVSPLSLTDIVLAVIAAGIALRLAWFCLGLWNLYRCRRPAVLVDAAPFNVDKSRIGSLTSSRTRSRRQAAILVSQQVRGPVTFGFLRPVIMLPGNFSAMQPEQQRAVLQHELLHVERSDWLFTLLEELCRAVLWFHPAVWWLIARIRLVREQVVDQATIDLTHDRQSYVEALLSIASTPQSGAFAGAPLFLSTRHLHTRMAQITK